ncbi:arylsulfotransferase (asst) [Halobacteriales archaeon QS_3_64_16]|nr:MAG: arylsulfotransferase (asst) [Halobacteriales archaeon QS_3_64_16]
MASVRSVLRAIFAVCLLLSGGVVASGYVAHSPADTAPAGNVTGSDAENRSLSELPPSSLTVVTTGSNRPRAESANGSRAEAEVVLYDRNGSIRYYNDTYDSYWDVDLLSKASGPRTVEYVASERLNASACESVGDDAAESGDGSEADGSTEDEKDGCVRTVIERLNLSTGATRTIHAARSPRADVTPWTDVDRINDTHYVIADRAENRVFVLNVRTNTITWEWYAASTFTFDSGGYYLEDWTHLNDVEYLEGGRIMASVRNHDQIVFLDPEHNRTILYEPYGPDYILRENGGPALLVADAGNNRVVEYARRDGSWNRTWQWSGPALRWPRDADRLPNGRTLVVDSNGDRVLEVNSTGTAVWNVSVGLPYDAERLGTGSASAAGPSAERIAARSEEMGDRDRTDQEEGRASDERAAGPLSSTAKGLLSGSVLSAALYVSPAWMGFVELLALCVLFLVSTVWFLAELRWRSVVAELREWAEEAERR